MSFEERGGRVVRNLVQQFALSPNQAAGIVGNLGYESIGFTTLQEKKPLVEGSAGGYGWAQWTAGRRRAFEAYCNAGGLDQASDEANYGFLCKELNSTHAYVLRALKHETELERCVFVFGRLYEAPFGTTATNLPGYEGRLDYAIQALDGYQADFQPDTDDLKPEAAPRSQPDMRADLTPRGSDPIGHQKAVVAAMTGPSVGVLGWWANARHGLGIPEHVIADMVGIISGVLVWITPHGRR